MGTPLRVVRPEVVILAGGKGTRLLPYTAVIPKPLVPLGEMPILEVLVRQLRSYGFRRILLAVGHMEHLIRAYFGNGRKWGVHIDYLCETRPLGTVGAIGMLRGARGPILVVNGDILTDLNFHSLLRAHDQSANLITLTVCKREIPVDFGVIDIGPAGRILDYREKPRLRYWVSAGIVAFAPRVVRLIARGEALNLPDLVKRALERNEKVGTLSSDAFWLDIGRPADYSLAQQIFERNPARFLRDGTR